MQQRDQGGEERPAGDEGPRAVDRVQQPHPFGIGPVGAEFLAPDAVFRNALAQESTQHQFGSTIGFRHRRGVGLAFHRHAGAEKGQDEATGGVRRGLPGTDDLRVDQGSGAGVPARLRR